MRQIAKTQTVGAIVKDSLFEDSVAFYGRWKSSHSVLHNCTFRGNGKCSRLCSIVQLAVTTPFPLIAGNPELEMQMLREWPS